MNLEALKQLEAGWSLEDFVDVANQLLPEYLPDIRGNTKVKEEINHRLVRHYTTQNLIDEPTRKNRYAVYTYRHLLQLLLVRRLLSDGIGTAAINDLVTSKDNDELKSLLTGGIQIHLTTAHPNITDNSNSALNFLENLRKSKSTNQLKEDDFVKDSSKENISIEPTQEKLNQLSSQPLALKTEWQRIQVLDGLELHLRSDFVYPNSVKEQESLNNHIIRELTKLLNRKKS